MQEIFAQVLAHFPLHGSAVSCAPYGSCTNPYGWTKLSEQILRDLAFAGKEWSVVLG